MSCQPAGAAALTRAGSDQGRHADRRREPLYPTSGAIGCSASDEVRTRRVSGAPQQTRTFDAGGQWRELAGAHGCAQRRGGKAGIDQSLEVAAKARAARSSGDPAVGRIGQPAQEHEPWIGPLGDRGHKPGPRQRQGVSRAELHGPTLRGLEHAQMPVEHQGTARPPRQTAGSTPGSPGQRRRGQQPRYRADENPGGFLAGEPGTSAAGEVRPGLGGREKGDRRPRAPAGFAQAGELGAGPALALGQWLGAIALGQWLGRLGRAGHGGGADGCGRPGIAEHPTGKRSSAYKYGGPGRRQVEAYAWPGCGSCAQQVNRGLTG